MINTKAVLKTTLLSILLIGSIASYQGVPVTAQTSEKKSLSEQKSLTHMLYKHQLTMGRLSGYKDIDKLRLLSSLQHSDIIDIPDAIKPYQSKKGFTYTVHSKSEIDQITKELFNKEIKPKALYSDNDYVPIAKFQKNRYHIVKPEAGGGSVRYSIQPQDKFKKLSNGLYYSNIDTYYLDLTNGSLEKLYPQVKKNSSYDWGKNTYLKNPKSTWSKLQKKLTLKESSGYVIMKASIVNGKKKWNLLEIEKYHKPLSQSELNKRIKWYK